MRTRTLGVSLLVHAAAVAAVLIAPLLAAPPRLGVPEASLVLVRPARLPVPDVDPPAPHAPAVASPSTTAGRPAPAPVTEPAALPPPPLFAPERASAGGPGVPRTSVGNGDGPLPPTSPPAVVELQAVGGVIGRPEKVVDVAPVYPPIARAAGVQGTVIIETVIDETGGVQDARVLRSVPLLDDAALAAVRQWRFTPTTLNGSPIPVVMTVTIRFELR